jgi:hypothetical protein
MKLGMRLRQNAQLCAAASEPDHRLKDAQITAVPVSLKGCGV